MAKYSIAGIPFPTKNAIVEYVRTLFECYDVGECLNDEHFQFVMELLKGHSRYKLKVGCGIKSVRIDLNTEWKKYKMFTLIRTDGTEADVSYRECVYPTSKKQHFAAACRNAVVDDILAFKQRHYDQLRDENNCVPCELSGVLVHWNDAHIDHAPPWTFQRIVEHALNTWHLDLERLELGGDEDGAFQNYFVDEKLKKQFKILHGNLARLRVVSKEVNLKLGRQ